MSFEDKEDGEQMEITDLLRSWKSGNHEALEELVPLVYDRMKRIAAAFLRGEREDHTMQTTALVHETFLKLVGQRKVDYRNREHFFTNVGLIMRRILVDHHRKRHRHKRGGHVEHVPDPDLFAGTGKAPDLVELDEALKHLEQEHPDWYLVVLLKFFVGLTIDEIAELLGIGPATVSRRWRLARAWLYRWFNGENT